MIRIMNLPVGSVFVITEHTKTASIIRLRVQQHDSQFTIILSTTQPLAFPHSPYRPHVQIPARPRPARQRVPVQIVTTASGSICCCVCGSRTMFYVDDYPDQKEMH